MDDAPTSARPPGLVVARRFRALAGAQDAARGTIGLARASHVRAVRFFPGPRLIGLLGGRRIDDIVHPAVPLGRDAGGLRRMGVDHPAARHAQRADALALGEIAVALAV